VTPTLRAVTTSVSHDLVLVDPDWALETLNAEFFITARNGAFYVMREFRQASDGALQLHTMTPKDFVGLHASQHVWFERKPKPLGKWWLEHQAARRMDEIVFNPDPHYVPAPGVYNKFKGFATTPAAGSWDRLGDYLSRVVCNGDPDLYEWLLEWFGFLVQRPHVPCGVCVALKGKPGTGKSTFGVLLRALVGAKHFVRVSNAQHVTGRFNSHFDEKIVLCSEEAYWAGDKAGEGVLKNMLTDDTLLIDGKYRAAYETKNCLHLVMLTNNDWVAPVGEHDRRFAIITTSEAETQNHEYFKGIYEDIAGAPLRAFMHDMLRRPLPTMLRKPVSSYVALDGDREQKMLTMDPFTSWLHGRLQEGVLTRRLRGVMDWPAEIAKGDLYDDYALEMRQTNIGRCLNEGMFGRRLLQRLPNLTDVKRRVQGKGPETRVRLWIMPSLEACRQALEASMGHPMLFSRIDDESDEDGPD
jgi:hypothetical protein